MSDGDRLTAGPADRHGIALRPIGHVRSPVADLTDAPRQPDEGAPPADLVIDPAYATGIDGMNIGDAIVVVTWLDRADRDTLVVYPRGELDRPVTGVFATRSPDRPNPLGLHDVTVTGVDGTVISVDAIEAVDGTPILDIKPRLGGVPGR